VTETYRVEGPVAIFLTTTSSEVDEELLNRCLVLTVDEGTEQTRAIHERQRRARTAEGRAERKSCQRIRRLHRNAQRLLKPLCVVNPFAPELRFMDHTTRTRRDHMKYLTMIETVTLFHQMQRPMKAMTHEGERIEYIESTREDIAIADRLVGGVLGRSLDELPPQTRKLLELVHAMVRERMKRESLEQHEVRFTRREVREWTRWGNTQLKVHFGRLEDHEYFVLHRAVRAGRGVTQMYELAYGGEGQEGIGLLGPNYDANWSGLGANWSGANLGEVGRGRGVVGGPESTQNGGKSTANGASRLNGAGMHVSGADQSRRRSREPS
jgi:hypothetical protein